MCYIINRLLRRAHSTPRNGERMVGVPNTDKSLYSCLQDVHHISFRFGFLLPKEE